MIEKETKAGKKNIMKISMYKFALRISIITLILNSILCSCSQESYEAVDYVNPFTDTHKSRWFFFASAARPFGMVSLSPDTWVKGSWDSGYLYDSLHVRCFSHIHAWQMSGIPVMPTVGEFKGHMGMEAYKSSFSHDDEEASPGYHSVNLKDYDVRAELTSTSRVGFHRYTFPEDTTKYVIFDVGAPLGHGKMDSAMVVKVSDHEIAGYSIMAPTRRRPKSTYVYFVAQFDQPVTNFGGWEQGELKTGELDEIQGPEVGAFVMFESSQSKILQMKVAISYTGIEQARLNLTSEIPHWNFDKVVEESEEEWNSYLGRIKVKGGTEKQKVKFYTDLWHALLGRKVVSDVDGKYCDMTGESSVIRQCELNSDGLPKHHQYNFDAWWGSHWTLNVLWSMVYPDVMDEFCASMVEMYRHGGLIPRGPSGGNYSYVMIGDPASSFFATAYNKGIRTYDIEKAYEGLYKNAFEGGIRDRAGYEHGEFPAGGGLNYYIERGYIPEGLEGRGFHKDGAAMTMEYAYQDWCLGQLSQALGKTDDYKLFDQRSGNYRNLWNPQTKFIHPKNMDGTWIENFEPIGKGFSMLGFVESNSAIYTNYVPHDLNGLMELFGGEDLYTQYVDSCFIKAKSNNFITDHGTHAESWVDYENQPSCQMAHLFNHSGAPWLSQKWVREVKEVTFGDISPYGGYNGDEDQGQMGALGVLMAIGLFQMDGGASVHSSYEITAPIFDEVEISLDSDYYSGDKFVISTENNSSRNIYIQQAKLNGQDWMNFSFSHEIFSRGGELKLVLGEEPNKKWGTLAEAEVLSDQKPTVSIVVWDGNSKEGQDLGEIRIYQLGEHTPGLEVKIECQGTANEGIDYRAFSNLQTVDKYRKITILPISDGITEGSEDVVIALLKSDDYEIDDQHSKASVRIIDGELPDIEFEMPSSVNNEANENAEVKIKLSRVNDKEIELDYTVQGVLADEGKDFQFRSNKLIIPAGEEEGIIKFQVNDDAVSEDDETVVIRLSSVSNANIAGIESHYYTIKNDDGEPDRSSVHDKIYGAVLGFRAGCAMGAITEYNWPQDRIEEIFGFQDEFIPYKHYGDTWTHPRGATEDGGERHKLICTAIIEKQDRISYQELKDVWLRDCEIEDMYHMTQPYDRTLLSFAKWGVHPADMPVTKFGTPRDLGEHIHLTARTFQALPCINAGDPENAIADMNEMGKLYYEDPKDDAFAWGAVYNAAMALAMLPDATVESVIEGALDYASPEIEKEIRHALAITEKYEDPMNRDLWQELSDMYMEPESKYYAFDRIEKYQNSSVYENVSYAFALFKATSANVKQSVIIATNRGYDTDCTAASAGALCGALSGSTDIPQEWIDTLDEGIANNPYTNAHFTNKATADGLYRALQNKVYRMETEHTALKSNDGSISKAEIDKLEDYVNLMKKCNVID